MNPLVGDLGHNPPVRSSDVPHLRNVLSFFTELRHEEAHYHKQLRDSPGCAENISMIQRIKPSPKKSAMVPVPEVNVTHAQADCNARK